MCFVSYLMHHYSDTVRIWRKKTAQFYSEQKYAFAADAKWWNSAARDENQWDVYNSRADTDIKWSKYQWSLYISSNMS